MLWAVSDAHLDTTFALRRELQLNGQAGGRSGVLTTPHGSIETPAFTPVGTLASVKGLTPQHIREVGSQAVLANAYHLYLQPGAQIVDDAGGVGAFMGWEGPTFTDSGGFQVMSLA
jgi:queuine tRNA-ribosyltransferase